MKVFRESVPPSLVLYHRVEGSLQGYSKLISTIHGLNPSGGFLKVIQLYP